MSSTHTANWLLAEPDCFTYSKDKVTRPDTESGKIGSLESLPSLDCTGELFGNTDVDDGDGVSGVLDCCNDPVCAGDSEAGAAVPLCRSPAEHATKRTANATSIIMNIVFRVLTNILIDQSPVPARHKSRVRRRLVAGSFRGLERVV